MKFYNNFTLFAFLPALSNAINVVNIKKTWSCNDREIFSNRNIMMSAHEGCTNKESHLLMANGLLTHKNDLKPIIPYTGTDFTRETPIDFFLSPLTPIDKSVDIKYYTVVQYLQEFERCIPYGAVYITPDGRTIACNDKPDPFTNNRFNIYQYPSWDF